MTDDDRVKSESFVKVDCGIVESSLYLRSRRDQRSLFLTALFKARPFELRAPSPALAIRSLDPHPSGFVVPPGWYGFVRVSPAKLLEIDGIDDADSGAPALEALADRDDDSRSREHDGRRLVRVDGGFVVLNYFVYRDRDYTAAERMRALRQRRKAQSTLFDGVQQDGEPDDDGDGGDGSGTPGIETSGPRYANGDEHVRNVTHAEGRGQTVEADKPEEKGGGAIVPVRSNGNGKSDVPPLPAISGKRNVSTIVARLGQVAEELKAGTRERLRKEQVRTLQVELVFAYWQAKFGKSRAQLDPERERRIGKRLEENKGDVSELFYVLDGALKDDWVRGTARGASHPNDGIDYIFRNRENVERFANMCPGYRQGKNHPMAGKYAAILSDVPQLGTTTAAPPPDAESPPRQLTDGANDG
jgi:hypothetical protein